MKNLIVIVLLFVSGCALYNNEKQYNEGRWHGVATSKEVSEIQRNKYALERQKIYDQLAVDKLKSQPVDVKVVNGVAQGYKGVIQNLSQEKINIVIRGPEERSFFLKSGEKFEDNLLPGNYRAIAYLNGEPTGKGWSFKVGVQKHIYQGKKVHWYVVHNPSF